MTCCPITRPFLGLVLVLGAGCSPAASGENTNGNQESAGGTTAGGTGAGVDSNGGSSNGGNPSGGSSVSGGAHVGSPDSGGTSGTGTGGTSGTGTGGEPDPGTGGLGTGPAFICPEGSELLTLSLENLQVEGPLGTLPTDNVNRQNLEGPVWIDGVLYTSHFSLMGNAESQILKYTPGGDFEIVFPDSGTNGLAVDGAGTLFGARRANGSISTFDLGDPGAEPLVVADMYQGLYFRAPNDLVIRSDGTIYFTDPRYEESGNMQSPRQTVERPYRISAGPDRTVHPIEPAPNIPNGIALSPDETVLYIGGSSLMKYVVADDGSVTHDGNFGSGSSDGLTVDCAGNVYAAGSGGVSVFSSGGDALGQIPVTGFSTNVAFGGPNRTTLYITRMSPPALYRVELNVPGFPY